MKGVRSVTFLEPSVSEVRWQGELSRSLQGMESLARFDHLENLVGVCDQSGRAIRYDFCIKPPQSFPGDVHTCVRDIGILIVDETEK